MEYEEPDPELAEVPESGVFADLLRDVAAAPRLPPELMRTLTFDAATGVMPSSPVLGRGLPMLGDVVDDRYRIDAELGRGGMGVVFRAHNLRTGRDVALKWMLPRGLSRSPAERSDSVQRFVREARAVSRIDHPNVVRVLDVGGDPDMPYLVMECLAGESLRARLTRGVLAWDEAIPIAGAVMQGVAAAHRAGVVHRDLKPDNIFLSADVVKVLDFGVSRIGDGEDQTTLTRTGTMLGTPAYMPLEQLRGSRDIDERTDVYALGVILFEALSGRLPFEAQTPADQAVLLATREPEDLGDLVPALKGGRAAAVMKALSRKPSDRHQSVIAFQYALTNAAIGSRFRGRPLTVSLLLLVAAAAVLWLWSPQESAPPAMRSIANPRMSSRPAVADSSPPRAPVVPVSPAVLTKSVTEVPPPPPAAATKGPAPNVRAKVKPQPQVLKPEVRSEPTALSVEHFKALEVPTPSSDLSPSSGPDVAQPRPTPALNPTEF